MLAEVLYVNDMVLQLKYQYGITIIASSVIGGCVLQELFEKWECEWFDKNLYIITMC